jgi:L-iditol 2-dehydrogenase
MKAARIRAPGGMRLEEIPVPEVPAGSIRVDVRACAVCGTDLRIFSRGDYRTRYYVMPGNEIAGIVEAVQPGVSGVGEGDGVCVALGHGFDGGFEEYLAVPERILRLGFVNPIPDTLSFQQASLSEVIACRPHVQENTPVHGRGVVLVIGAGSAGVIHTQLARRAGAKKVPLAQRSRRRLELVKERFPVNRIVTSSDEDLEGAFMEETGGEGADATFVCAPSAEAQGSAFRLLAPRGRINFFGVLPPEGRAVRLDSNNIHYRDHSISGAPSSLPAGNRGALELHSERRIEPDLLVTDVFPIDEILGASETAERREGIKVGVNL